MNVQKYWTRWLALMGDATGARNVDEFQRKHLAAMTGSAAKVSLTGAVTLTKAAHANSKKLYLNSAVLTTLTLPAATGSGDTYSFRVIQTNTNSYVIKVANSSDVMRGSIQGLDNDANAVTGYAATGTDDTLTLNGTTTGGLVGDSVTLEDIAVNTWRVNGTTVTPAGSNVADCFSATV